MRAELTCDDHYKYPSETSSEVYKYASCSTCLHHCYCELMFQNEEFNTFCMCQFCFIISAVYEIKMQIALDNVARGRQFLQDPVGNSTSELTSVRQHFYAHYATLFSTNSSSFVIMLYTISSTKHYLQGKQTE